MRDNSLVTLLDVGSEVSFFDGSSFSVLALKNFLDLHGMDSRIIPACEAGVGDRPRAESVAEFVINRQGDLGNVLGVSCTSDYLPQALFLARALKHLNGKFVMLGGVGPSVLADEIMARYPFVDAVCVGEGEETLLQVAEKGHDPGTLMDIEGVLFRSPAGEVVNAGTRPRIRSLNTLPITHAAMELEDDPLGYDRMVHLTTSRGCPGSCSFCSHHAVWGRYRSTLSMDRLCDFLLENGYQGDRTLLVLHDDTFIFPESRLLALQKELNRRRLAIRWASFGRIADISASTGPVLRDTGCEEITIGVDGYSEDILVGMNKPFGLHKAKEAIASLLNCGVSVRINLIWDWPGETYRDFEGMVHFAYESLCLGAIAGMSRLQVYPKTRLFSSVGPGMITDNASLQTLGHRLGDAADFVRRDPLLFPNFFRHSYSRDTRRKINLFKKTAFMFAGDQTRRTRFPVRWMGRNTYRQ